jgi:hypothetical protein
MKQRIYAIDFMKFIAVLFITNSHAITLYKDINPALATLGVHGNAIFFFVSGFTLALKDLKNINFIDFYKKRLARIYPTLIMWPILANFLFQEPITWDNILLAKGYWFIQCILFNYILLYFLSKQNNRFVSISFLLSIFITILVVCISPKSNLSIYHSFHYICYLSSMILGIYCGRVKVQNSKYSGLYTMLSFIAYFFIMSFGKNQFTFIYYSQLLAIIPLHLFLYYMFVWCNSWGNNLENKIYHKPIYWIGNLCLEIYVVQKFLFTDKFNNIFPLNILIVFIGIFSFAYILHICTNILIQTIQTNSYNIKKILSI